MSLVTPVRRWKLFWVSPCYHVGRRIRLSVILLHRVCGTPHCERPRWLWTWVSWWNWSFIFCKIGFCFIKLDLEKSRSLLPFFFPSVLEYCSISFSFLQSHCHFSGHEFLLTLLPCGFQRAHLFLNLERVQFYSAPTYLCITADSPVSYRR